MSNSSQSLPTRPVRNFSVIMCRISPHLPGRSLALGGLAIAESPAGAWFDPPAKMGSKAMAQHTEPKSEAIM